MIRREFLMTAGVTVAAVSILGPAVWAKDPSPSATETASRPAVSAGWMYGCAGGCATAVMTEPVVPMWVTA